MKGSRCLPSCGWLSPHIQVAQNRPSSFLYPWHLVCNQGTGMQAEVTQPGTCLPATPPTFPVLALRQGQLVPQSSLHSSALGTSCCY